MAEARGELRHVGEEGGGVRVGDGSVDGIRADHHARVLYAVLYGSVRTRLAAARPRCALDWNRSQNANYKCR